LCSRRGVLALQTHTVTFHVLLSYLRLYQFIFCCAHPPYVAHVAQIHQKKGVQKSMKKRVAHIIHLLPLLLSLFLPSHLFFSINVRNLSTTPGRGTQAVEKGSSLRTSFILNAMLLLVASRPPLRMAANVAQQHPHRCLSLLERLNVAFPGPQQQLFAFTSLTISPGFLRKAHQSC
jgi:hypothetical protein